MKKQFISLVLTALSGMVLAQDASTNTSERLVRYSFTLTNEKGNFVPDAEFWVRAPVKQTAHQLCTSIKTSDPYELVSDENGNQTLHFIFKDFPPHGRKIVRVEAHLAMSADSADVSLNPSVYLGPAPLMELDYPEFKELVPNLGNGRPDRIARMAMNWMRQNIKDAGYLKRDHGALYALQKKEGDCTEQAYLFAALCRAHNIPARVLGGYVSPGNAVFGPNGYHNWAEFYDGTHWQVADPQRGVFATQGGEYIMLCVADDQGPLTGTARFRVNGDGLTAKMN